MAQSTGHNPGSPLPKRADYARQRRAAQEVADREAVAKARKRQSQPPKQAPQPPQRRSVGAQASQEYFAPVTSATARPASASSASAQSRGRSAKSKSVAKKKSGWGRRIGLTIVFAFLLSVIAGAGLFLYMYSRATIPAASDLALAQKTSIYYSDGTTKLGDLGEVNREIIDTTTLPDYVGKAIVASEDRTFYTNSGVDLKGIARALFNNVTTGSRQGGSTLTQQYVERYYTGETTSYKGKVKEAVLAIKINREQSKDEVLANYMNTIYFGRGAYGIEAAAKAYYGHSADEMTLSEAAMIAGIIPAPSAWDPAVDADQAKTRWERVLNLMVEDGWISQAESDEVTFPETIDPATVETESMSGPNGYLIQQVKEELLATGAFTEESLDEGGLKITSTIDQTKQDQAVAAAQTMSSVSGWDPATMHVALSSIDPATGEIVAEFGGDDYLARQQNAVTQDIAMAGSSFKPFALIANARAGGSVYDTYSGSSPQSFPGLTEPVRNNANVSYGKINLITATEYSVNTSFVALNKDIGPAATMQAAIDAGIPESTLGLDSSLLNVLGFASPHNIDLASAYATIANGGQRMTPHIVRSVADSADNTIFTTTVEARQAFSSTDVSAIMPALQAVTASGGTAETVSSTLPGFTTAGKTGTSNDQLSAQFIGFVPELVTAVSMYQSDEEGNAVSLANIGGLDQFHGGDWPVTVWNTYMSAISSTLSQQTFSWYVAPKRQSNQQTMSQSGAQAPQTETSEQPPTESNETQGQTPGQTPTPAPPRTDQQNQNGTDNSGQSQGGSQNG